MEQRTLGKTGIKTSVLGFGGSEIGFNPVDQSTVASILDEALDCGVNLIDTAAAYVNSEALLGEALKGRRDKVTLVTKCGAIDGFAKSDWSFDGILKTVQESLTKLQTDHVDVLLLHSCGPIEFQLGEAGKALQEAKQRGYTRFIGYSGDNAAALAAIESGIFEVLETSLGIADQEPIDLTLPLAKAAGMGVIIKRPIANAVWKKGPQTKTDYSYQYGERLKRLGYDFLAKSPDDVSTALRFTLSQPGVSTAIVGASKPGRFKENVKIVDAGPLPEAVIRLIRGRWSEVSDPTWVGQI